MKVEVINLQVNWLTWILLLLQARTRSPILPFLFFSLFELILYFKWFQLFAFLVHFLEILNHFKYQLIYLFSSVSHLDQFSAILELHSTLQNFLANFQWLIFTNFDNGFITHYFLDKMRIFHLKFFFNRQNYSLLGHHDLNHRFKYFYQFQTNLFIILTFNYQLNLKIYRFQKKVLRH